MIFEHEIPEGSRLYFAGTAKTKRLIEAKASELLSASGIEEIVTPLFLQSFLEELIYETRPLDLEPKNLI